MEIFFSWFPFFWFPCGFLVVVFVEIRVPVLIPILFFSRFGVVFRRLARGVAVSFSRLTKEENGTSKLHTGLLVAEGLCEWFGLGVAWEEGRLSRGGLFFWLVRCKLWTAGWFELSCELFCSVFVIDS